MTTRAQRPGGEKWDHTAVYYTIHEVQSRVMHLWSQSPWIKNIRKNNSRKFQKANLNLPHAYNYSHSTYIVLGIVINLEML